MEQWKHQTKTGPKPNGISYLCFPIRMPFIYTTHPIKVYLNLITVHLVMGVSIWTKQGTGNINLKEDPNWTVEAINEAMKGEKQTIHILEENPVHIRYFTVWLTILERSIFIMIYIKETIV
jgi:hypothetical protein